MEISSEAKDLIIELSKQAKKIKDIRKEIFDRIGENVSERTVIRVRVKNKVATNTNSSGEVYLPIRDEKRLKRDDTTFKSDGSQTHTTLVQMDEEQSKDPDFVLRAHGYDPDNWDLIQHVHNIWQQHSIADGTNDLMQSKITVKPKMKTVTVEDLIAAMSGKIKENYVANEKFGRNSIVIPLFDLHFGITKLEMLQDSLNQINQILSSGYQRVVIVVGGDTLHSDFMSKSQTAHNTQLDHVNNIKSLDEAAEFVSSIIEMGLKYAPEVQLHAISGNHDENKQYMFLWGLQQKYPQVKFDNNLNTRTAFGFDEIGIMAAHGNLALKRLPMLMANEYPELWARSKYREVMSGHFHTEKLTDESGVIMHAYGTPKPNDNYEYANGFTMNRKQLKIEEFNQTRLVATYVVE